MLKRFLMMLLICGCLLYAPTARACEESPLPYWMDYQAFLSEYRSAIVEDRDTIGGWQLSAAAKVAGPEGTGYAFVWMDEDDVPELLIGDLSAGMSGRPTPGRTARSTSSTRRATPAARCG